MKFFLPYYKLFFGTILTILPLYFGLPYFLIFFILINSLLIALNQNIEKSIIFYLILSFLIPSDFLTLSTGYNIGLIINEYFFAGIPLYFSLPGVLFNRNFKTTYTRSQKIIFYTCIILLFTSNILPGILNLLGLGGYRVRLIFLFNFFNSLLIFYFISGIKLNKSLLKLISDYIIILGFFSAILGILQYIFNIPIIPNTSFTDFSRLNTININNAVDSCPYLIVPFIFTLSRLIYKRKISLKYTFILFVIFSAIFFTFSRWAILTIFITLVLIVWKNRSFFYRKALIILFISSLISPLFFIIGQNALESDEQRERLTSYDNLFVRVYLWGLATTAIYDNPFGYGFGNGVEAMFSNDSEFNFIDENSTNSVDTFQRQSVHQFFLDYMLSLGAIFGIVLLFLFWKIFDETNKLLKISSYDLKYFYLSLYLSCFALFIFYFQNVGSQMFYLFLFLGLSNRLKFDEIKLK